MNPQFRTEEEKKKFLYDLDLAIEAIKKNDLELPLELWPNEMPCPNPGNGWDHYENDRFNENYKLCEEYWNSLLRKARKKIKKEKKKNKKEKKEKDIENA